MLLRTTYAGSTARIVIGSAVYMGQWRKEAVQFLKRNAFILETRPTWLFSLPDQLVRAIRSELLGGWRFPKAIRSMVERIEPRDTAAISWCTGYQDKLNFLERYVIKNVKAPVGDFRDWERIDAWAEKIVAELDLKPLMAL